MPCRLRMSPVVRVATLRPGMLEQKRHLANVRSHEQWRHRRTLPCNVHRGLHFPRGPQPMTPTQSSSTLVLQPTVSRDHRHRVCASARPRAQ